VAAKNPLVSAVSAVSPPPPGSTTKPAIS